MPADLIEYFLCKLYEMQSLDFVQFENLNKKFNISEEKNIF